MPQEKSKKSIKTGGKLIVKKNFLADELTTTSAKRFKLSASKLSYLFETFIKVGERNPAAYNFSYSYVDKSLRSVSQGVSNKLKETWIHLLSVLSTGVKKQHQR